MANVGQDMHAGQMIQIIAQDRDLDGKNRIQNHRGHDAIDRDIQSRRLPDRQRAGILLHARVPARDSEDGGESTTGVSPITAHILLCQRRGRQVGRVR